MTNKLKWRLTKLPTSTEVIELVKNKLISEEEAKEILFSEETEVVITEESLKSEIKFLRELVDKLSSKSQIVETIKYIEKPYYTNGWYQPYQVWCGSALTTKSSSGTTYLSAGGSNALSVNAMYTSASNLSDVSTF